MNSTKTNKITEFQQQQIKNYSNWKFKCKIACKTAHNTYKCSLMDLVAIVMEIYGLLFLIVWCGVFGRKEIVGVLKTMSVQCLISSFYFSEPYWTGSQCGETNLFLQFWIYLIYVIFVFDMYTPVYSLCIWVSLFFISINLYYLSKKKNVLRWISVLFIL